MKRLQKLLCTTACGALLASAAFSPAKGCTGIRLTAKDSSVVFGRTLEWGAFDVNSRVAISPRKQPHTGLTPDGLNGKKWHGKYGIIGLDLLGKDIYADAMNETGLQCGFFYHPGTAEYMKYNVKQAKNTITAVDVVTYLLSQYSTIDEVRKGISEVRVVGVVEEALGFEVQGHWVVTEPSGKSIVIEYLKNELHIFDNPLGVITNSPEYSWHMTNLRNYINLSSTAIPTKNIEDLDFAPLGGGSGMIGLPGDYTPPSRFVRAVAWSQTARPVETANEGIYELFRILDNFNVPLGAGEGSDNMKEGGTPLRSETQWTTAWDLSGKVLYFHDQHNRRVRKIDVNKVNFEQKEIVNIPLNKESKQDIKDITPVQ